MKAKTIAYASSLAILPALFLIFYGIRVFGRAYGIDQWLPKWDTLLIIGTMIVLERIYTYRYAVSQRSVLARDVIANVVNLYVTGALAGMIVLPVLLFFPEHFLGRKLVFATPGQLGPLWLQVLVILLSVSFFRYWMHRAQHSVPFLWALHSYHHRVTDLQGTNTFVSHPIDFALRNVVIYLVLGVLYESFTHPLTILSTLPSAGVGALLALWAGGFDLSVIGIIGIILLIGIVKKNGIMLVDFAINRERAGLEPREAIRQACLLRFRPIVMTTMTALLSGVALMFSHGSGSELRQPLGYSMVGGLALSQVLTLYTTPVIYLYLDRFQDWLRGHKEGPQREEALPLAAE